MNDTLIVTFIARDRPGVVEQLSQLVNEHGGSWQESRMAHLADTFAGVALVKVAAEQTGALHKALIALTGDEFEITVRSAGNMDKESGGEVITFDIEGPDHTGIVHDLTRTIAGLGASVEEMETWVEAAPVSGTLQFHATTTVRLPDGLSQEAFSDALEERADALFVDLALSGEK